MNKHLKRDKIQEKNCFQLWASAQVAGIAAFHYFTMKKLFLSKIPLLPKMKEILKN